MVKPDRRMPMMMMMFLSALSMYRSLDGTAVRQTDGRPGKLHNCHAGQVKACVWEIKRQNITMHRQKVVQVSTWRWWCTCMCNTVVPCCCSMLGALRKWREKKDDIAVSGQHGLLPACDHFQLPHHERDVGSCTPFSEGVNLCNNDSVNSVLMELASSAWGILSRAASPISLPPCLISVHWLFHLYFIPKHFPANPLTVGYCRHGN